MNIGRVMKPFIALDSNAGFSLIRLTPLPGIIHLDPSPNPTVNPKPKIETLNTNSNFCGHCADSNVAFRLSLLTSLPHITNLSRWEEGLMLTLTLP